MRELRLLIRLLQLCAFASLLVILLLVSWTPYGRRREGPTTKLSKLQRTDDSDSNQSWKKGKGIELLTTKDYSNTVQRKCKQKFNQDLLADKSFKPLTTQQTQEVVKFLFFAGYPRSGHSIIGSLLDAHPNIILSFGFFLFNGLMTPSGRKGSIECLLQNKTLFFNTLYERSYHYSLVSSKIDNKGYTLDVPGMWSGRFNRNLRIIGDKSALATTSAYSKFSNSLFKQRYEHLSECVDTEIVTIHVVRNPFDMIATATLYRTMKFLWKKENNTEALQTGKKLIDDSSLLNQMKFFFNKAEAMKEMVPLCGMNILVVHIEDMIKSPKKEMQRLSKFLQVDFSEQYLKACEEKISKNVSRTRDKVVWPPHIRAEVERRMKLFPFFKGYTFEDDFYNPAQVKSV